MLSSPEFDLKAIRSESIFTELLNVLSKWLIRKKTNRLHAQKYVTLLYSALAELALANSSKPLKNLVNEQTPGGLNWQGVNE